jgi:hypothetical protein
MSSDDKGSAPMSGQFYRSGFGLSPIDAAVEGIYYDIRESFELAMKSAGLSEGQLQEILTTVDDAVGNDSNWDQLMAHLKKVGVDVGDE